MVNKSHGQKPEEYSDEVKRALAFNKEGQKLGTELKSLFFAAIGTGEISSLVKDLKDQGEYDLADEVDQIAIWLLDITRDNR